MNQQGRAGRTAEPAGWCGVCLSRTVSYGCTPQSCGACPQSCLSHQGGIRRRLELGGRLGGSLRDAGGRVGVLPVHFPSQSSHRPLLSDSNSDRSNSQSAAQRVLTRAQHRPPHSALTAAPRGGADLRAAGEEAEAPGADSHPGTPASQRRGWLRRGSLAPGRTIRLPPEGSQNTS